MDRLLKAGELAELLNVTERWVLEHTRSGNVPCVRLGRNVRYRLDAVLEWLDDCEQAGRATRLRKAAPGVRPGGTK